MTALTQAAIIVRRLFTLGLFLGAASLITLIFYTLGKPVWQSFFPQATPAPTLAFGKLPTISTQGLLVSTNSAGISYKIDTKEGKVPNLPQQAKVYKIIKRTPSLLLYDRVKQRARNMGFPGGPIILSETSRKFTDRDILLRTLEIQVINGNFTIDTPKNEWTSLASRELALILEQKSADLAKGFLEKNGYLYQDLGASGKITRTPLKISQDQFGNITLKEAVSPPELTDFFRVDFFRNDIEKIPIIPLEDNKANISLLISPKSIDDPRYSSNKNIPIILTSYIYWPVSQNQQATYPLKTSQDAFKELQTGQGIVLSGRDRDVSIRKIYLAYLEEKKEPDFLQPVIVFEGQNSQKGLFRAIVPAVKN